MKGELEVDRCVCVGDKATYLGMGIGKVDESDSEGIILDSDNYEGGINHVEIPHERAKRRNESLTEAGETILRSELWKLMRIARIARPGAIYDASAAAQTCTVSEMVDISEEKEEFAENEEKEDSPGEGKSDFGHMPGFSEFLHVCVVLTK